MNSTYNYTESKQKLIFTTLPCSQTYPPGCYELHELANKDLEDRIQSCWNQLKCSFPTVRFHPMIVKKQIPDGFRENEGRHPGTIILVAEVDTYPHHQTLASLEWTTDIP